MRSYQVGLVLLAVPLLALAAATFRDADLAQGFVRLHWDVIKQVLPPSLATHEREEIGVGVAAGVDVVAAPSGQGAGEAVGALETPSPVDRLVEELEGGDGELQPMREVAGDPADVAA